MVTKRQIELDAFCRQVVYQGLRQFKLSSKDAHKFNNIVQAIAEYITKERKLKITWQKAKDGRYYKCYDRAIMLEVTIEALAFIW